MSNVTRKIGIIGGSGFAELTAFEKIRSEQVNTPYGLASSALTIGELNGQEVAFIARHGADHSILPHQINYRANLWALKQSGADAVIAIATVGGIGKQCRPGSIVIPDQILDYTHSREHTFAQLDGVLFHIDFTQPYCEALRAVLLQCAGELGIDTITSGTYASTQGPRFESTAEVDRLRRDGADIVGMTGMPETSLARELGLCYATLALVVNYAAGRSGSQINVDEIRQAQQRGSTKVGRILYQAVLKLRGFKFEVPPLIKP